MQLLRSALLMLSASAALSASPPIAIADPSSFDVDSSGAKTTITVVNNHINAIKYELKATGIGGCGDKNQPLDPGSVDGDDCYCSWGTLNNKFIAYDVKSLVVGAKLCESQGVGDCYAHTSGSRGYTCTVTYEGHTAGVPVASCQCVQN